MWVSLLDRGGRLAPLCAASLGQHLALVLLEKYQNALLHLRIWAAGLRVSGH